MGGREVGGCGGERVGYNSAHSIGQTFGTAVG